MQRGDIDTRGCVCVSVCICARVRAPFEAAEREIRGRGEKKVGVDAKEEENHR